MEEKKIYINIESWGNMVLLGYYGSKWKVNINVGNLGIYYYLFPQSITGSCIIESNKLHNNSPSLLWFVSSIGWFLLQYMGINGHNDRQSLIEKSQDARVYVCACPGVCVHVRPGVCAYEERPPDPPTRRERPPHI